MDVLPLQFRILRYFGLWREPSEQQNWLVKYIGKPLVIGILAFFTITQLGAMQVYRDNISEFTECLFMSFTWLAFSLKFFNFLWRTDDMNDLLQDFRESIFIPRNDDERRILVNYREYIWNISILYVCVIHSTAVAFELLPLISLAFGSESLELPYKTYELYDRDNLLYYSIAYLFQVGCFLIGPTVNVCLDTLLCGFILLICAQIDISRHRFVAMTSNGGDYAKATRECVVHQQLIRRVIRKVQAFFMCVVVPQLFFSLSTLCTSLYNLTRMKMVESFVLVMYLGCLQCQIFFYCWFGNELKLKTSTICQTIFHSDWADFSPSDRKNLSLTLLVCQKDMSISFHGFCPVTLDIYIWVLKTSYAAYNLLKSVETENE